MNYRILLFSIFITNCASFVYQHRNYKLFNRASSRKSGNLVTLMTPLPQSDDNNNEQYRNRAALLEAVTKEKVNEIKDLKAKLQVVQDVVGKLKVKSKQSLEWKEQFEESERERKETKQALERLQREWNITLSEWEDERKRYQQDQRRVERSHEDERRKWEMDRQRLQESDARLQQQIKALQREVLDLDQSLESTDQELIQLQKQLREEQENAREQVESERKKVLRLKEKLNQALAERDSVLDKLEQQQIDLQEQLQIATASVSAAERRENAAQNELANVKSDYAALFKEKATLNNLLKEAEAQIAALENSMIEKETSDPLIEGRLRADVLQLEDQIRSIRTVHNSEKALMEKMYEQKIQDTKADYEEKIRQLKEETSKPGQPQGITMSKVLDRIRRRFRRK